jgi:hypothetical protein
MVNPLGFRKLKATVTERAHGFAVMLDAENEKSHERSSCERRCSSVRRDACKRRC